MRFELLARCDLSADAEAWLDWCLRAEQLGYAGVWLDDAVHAAAGPAAALIFATAAVSRTRQLRVGLIGTLAGPGRMKDAMRLAARLTNGRLVTARDIAEAGPLCRVLLVPKGAPTPPPAAPEVLVGEPESVAARLWPLWAADPDGRLVLEFVGLLRSPLDSLPTLETFSREVMPRFSPQPLLPQTFA